MYLKSHWISEAKINFTEEQTIGMSWPSSIFMLFFPDCRTLKFLKMECNPTNKKTVA